VGAGTSAGTQKTADVLVLQLILATPADATRFVSMEPLLEPVDLGGYYLDMKLGREVLPMLGPEHRTKLIDLLDLVIVGGESGPGSRSTDFAWVRSIRD